jgi:hypothetical protein
MPTTEAPTQLATITTQTGLSVESANTVIAAFAPLYLAAQELVKAGRGFEVKGEDDAEGIAKAREMRLKLRKVRCEAENVRKAMKEEGLRFGKALDRVAAVVKDLIEPVETELEEQEQIQQRMAAFRRSELQEARWKLLADAGVNAGAYPNIADMPQPDFEALLTHFRELRRKAEEERKAAEEKRKAEEAARQAEAERIRAENARLKKEAEEREAAARAEREKLEAATRAEREAREKAERELQARRAAEEKKKREEEEARAKAERAPDKEKLLGFAVWLRDVRHHAPVLASNEAQAILNDAIAHCMALATKIEWKAGEL